MDENLFFRKELLQIYFCLRFWYRQLVLFACAVIKTRLVFISDNDTWTETALVASFKTTVFKTSSVRRILKRGGGGKKFKKFGKNKDLNQKLFLPNLVRFFAQNQVKNKNKNKNKKGLHSNLVQFLAQSLEETHRTCPLCDQTLCPTCKGGGGHASILLTFLCNFAILTSQVKSSQVKFISPNA